MIPVLASLLAVSGAFAPSAAAQTMRERQWYLDKMQAEKMWKVSTGKGITVAVLDGGVNPSVPELAGKVLKGKNFVEPEKGAHRDKDGHGSAMAMLIAGNGVNNQGIKGLAPGAQILPLTIFGSTKTETNSVPGMVKAIRYAADSDARILNISVAFNMVQLDDKQEREIEEAAAYAIKRGKLIFAGAGNDGDKGNFISYPAAVNGVVAVGAYDSEFSWAKFSSYGGYLGLSAPGVDIPIRCGPDQPGYCHSEGTSQATALASASAALIWAKHPDWTGNQVLRVMIETAGKPDPPLPSRYLGYGSVRPRLNVLENKGNPGPADVNPLVELNEKRSSDGKSPSPSASKKPAAPASPGEKGEESETVDSSASGSGSDPAESTGRVIGAVGVCVAAFFGVRAVVRRRKAARAQSAPPAAGAPPYPYPYPPGAQNAPYAPPAPHVPQHPQGPPPYGQQFPHPPQPPTAPPRQDQ
ncbi:hypothetical protein CD790_05500 [Streptomyces sp. SAJ15]|nr:hypothetical protein CD790_05500 [Streptomyces sp. SAJ15]